MKNTNKILKEKRLNRSNIFFTNLLLLNRQNTKSKKLTENQNESYLYS